MAECSNAYFDEGLWDVAEFDTICPTVGIGIPKSITGAFSERIKPTAGFSEKIDTSSSITEQM